MPETLTVDALLPEVQSYLAAIAAEHGEPAPEFDADVMRDVLTGLLEQPEQPEPEEGQLFSRPGPAEQYARTKHAKTGQGSLWDESEHPRAADGEFTAGSGEKGEETEEEKPKAAVEPEKPAATPTQPKAQQNPVAPLHNKPPFEADDKRPKPDDRQATISHIQSLIGDYRDHLNRAGYDRVNTLVADLTHMMTNAGNAKTRKELAQVMADADDAVGQALNLVRRPEQLPKNVFREMLVGHNVKDNGAESREQAEEWTDHALDEWHKDELQKALKDGRAVPPEVLADYPDLKPSASKQGSEGEKPAKAAAAETTGESEPAEAETAEPESAAKEEPKETKRRPASWPKTAGPQNRDKVAGKNYAGTVSANLAQMEAPSHEWGAVPVKGMTETTNDRGDSVSMPEFDFPQGYDHAPSVFHDQDGCCNLCGHDIKNVFWIQNDEKKWVMPVGSECVSNFGEGHSGAKAAKQSIAEANRDTVRQLEDARRAIRLKHTHETPNRVMSGGTWFTSGTKRVWNNDEEGRAAKELHDRIAEALGDVSAKVGAHNVRTGKYDPEEPVWTDRQIANWIKKNAETAGKLLKDADKHLPKPPPAKEKEDEDDTPV